MIDILLNTLCSVQDVGTRLVFGIDQGTTKEHFYSLVDKTLGKGEEVSMSKYKGRVLCLVNVASQWGLTDANYSQLVKLHDKYHSQGFDILAFPCNQFGGQEPGTPEEILQFAKKYDGADSKFIFFEKGHVNGAQTREVYSYLKQKIPGDIRWNFSTFFVDHQGSVAHRCSPTKAVVKELEPLIQELLKTKQTES